MMIGSKERIFANLIVKFQPNLNTTLAVVGFDIDVNITLNYPSHPATNFNLDEVGVN